MDAIFDDYSFFELLKLYKQEYKTFYGTNDFDNVVSKINTSKAANEVFQTSVEKQIVPTGDELISVIMGISLLGFAKPETIGLASICILEKINDKNIAINKWVPSANFKDSLLRALLLCRRMKF